MKLRTFMDMFEESDQGFLSELYQMISDEQEAEAEDDAQHSFARHIGRLNCD
jgi:hypothetical protein